MRQRDTRLCIENRGERDDWKTQTIHTPSLSRHRERETENGDTHTHIQYTLLHCQDTEKHTERHRGPPPHRDTSKHKKHKVYCGCGCPLSLCLSLSRDSEGVVLSVFSNRLSPLISIHTSVSLCFTETQTDRLRDQQRRVWGEYED